MEIQATESDMAKRPTYNLGPGAELPDDAPRDAFKIEFARRLQKALVAKNWNQSDLARRVKDLLPKESKFGRDAVSVYIRGKSLPDPTRLKAIAQALGVQPDDLLPARGRSAAANNAPPLDVRDLGDGNVWLRVNQSVPWPLAIELMKLLKS